MFIFVTCDVSVFAGFAWFLARAVLNTNSINFTHLLLANLVAILRETIIHIVKLYDYLQVQYKLR